MMATKRLLAVLLLCYLAQLHECLKLPSVLKGKTEAEKAEAERWKAAKDAYKCLFVRSAKFSEAEVLEKLQALEPYQEAEGIDMPIDFRDLIAYNEPQEAHCDDREFVQKLRQRSKEAKRKYPALRDYLASALERQVDLCNYENRFEQVMARFMQESPQQWQLILDFNQAAGQFGVREFEWREDRFLDNQLQMNEALEQMFANKQFTGEWQGYELTQKAYTLATELKGACRAFSDRVGASLLMATMRPHIKQNAEMVDWLRYLNVCGQVERTNFERAIGRMFSEHSVPGFNEAWDQYRGYREMWV